MSKSTPPELWVPQGVNELEPISEDAVRSSKNSVVIAGPGAGKTELLAQRACYLLQTGLCENPRCILAISFKKDAAHNLSERVRLRCGPDLGRRFHSYTFDAFAKGLVDRFGQALPPLFKPSAKYVLNFKIEANYRQVLESVPSSLGGLTQGELAQINAKTAYRYSFIGKPLSKLVASTGVLDDRAAVTAWRYLLSTGQSNLNFQMIGRLAEHILHANPLILRALRATYSHVFLDEFQDTTSIHYDLTATAFRDSQAVLTAVGDGKQSIMRWALALKGVFAEFTADFSAEVFKPVRNYRAAPELVRIVGHLSTAIETDSQKPVAVDDGSSGNGECRLLAFSSHLREATYLAELVEQWINADGVDHREICILTRQRPDVYCESLIKELRDLGIHARVEHVIQDLLAEPVIELILDCLQLTYLTQSNNSWNRLLDFMLSTHAVDSERAARAVELKLTNFCDRLASDIPAPPNDLVEQKSLTSRILNFLGEHELRARYPQYDQGGFMATQLDAFNDELAKYISGGSWSEILGGFIGADAVPIMTVHKAKGLEYHSVIFLGFEDYVFRGFKQMQDDEEACAFFVALSRAKQRVIFTFAKQRAGATQTLRTIKPLFDLLVSAGVQPQMIAD